MELLILLALLGTLIGGLVWLHQATPAALTAFVERESVVFKWLKAAPLAIAARIKAARAKVVAAPRVEPVAAAPGELSDHAKAVKAILALPLSIEERLHLVDSLKV
jgi:hypothetical protein